MITRLTRILLVLQAATAIALFALAIRVLHINSLPLAILLSMGCVALVRLLIVANNFFLSWLYRSETPVALQIGRRRALRMFCNEFHASMASSSWTMAFHSFSKRAADHPAGLPVLLIHGYGCNSGYWHAMSKALRKAQITHYAIDLEPVFAGIDDYVPVVHRAVESMRSETGHEKVIILAHSMGGLVARAYLRDHGCAHIAKVITLGTPHRGTALANFGAGPNSRQMRWAGSADGGMANDWLRRLEQSESDAVRALFVSIYSHHDNIVSPQTSSQLAGARNIEFHGIGHVALALNPMIQARVIEEILAASQQTRQKAAVADEQVVAGRGIGG